MLRGNRKFTSFLAVLSAFLMAFALNGCDARKAMQAGLQSAQPESFAAQGENTDTLVYYLDVGQGDSELIRLASGKTVLIDAGTPDTADALCDMLEKLGVSKIDILIATHPHADHIGGMAKVVGRFPIGEIYMPRIPDKQVPTTATYEKLLTAIDSKGMKVTEGKAGMTVLDADGEKLEFLAPNSKKYTDLNNYSIVALLTCGEKRFLFMGDAQTDSEKEILKKETKLNCDVLKCGHHGSSTSTSAAFLKAAAPQSAVISCGVNNDYGHPDKKTVARLQKAGVMIYRTDRQKTILARCDGKTVQFETGLASVAQS
ncbi:hydroxyacylglutathione hydrolase [Caproiciproducens galactitolivorans]|uniref:Hydroxyacylglutathione hydrolase n=1 Tax=Caproiciproducens galactitolivorans TaxID=642589 RepID=A0A4Z0Y0L7_9FIRM|nr:ComEC/Rec2 family competence protein [Caproiciproducens galactitolivorans]TGJ76377.1 hydroxyacylglutathione hydrolase [Caproiciproducens galactitolivorans]